LAGRELANRYLQARATPIPHSNAKLSNKDAACISRQQPEHQATNFKPDEPDYLLDNTPSVQKILTAYNLNVSLAVAK